MDLKYFITLTSLVADPCAEKKILQWCSLELTAFSELRVDIFRCLPFSSEVRVAKKRRKDLRKLPFTNFDCLCLFACLFQVFFSCNVRLPLIVRMGRSSGAPVELIACPPVLSSFLENSANLPDKKY